jgi:hypothetical protein
MNSVGTAKRGTAITVATLLLAVTLAGCSGGFGEASKTHTGYPYRVGTGKGDLVYGRDIDDVDSKRTSIFGKGNSLFGNQTKPNDGGGSGGIGVNSYLWRASLETISFMPVSSADPFGGVVITDWYTPGETPNERFKLNIYILGKALRADGVKVAVFRQVKDASGGWTDANTPDQTGIKIEDAILTKARQLRNNLAQQ